MVPNPMNKWDDLGGKPTFFGNTQYWVEFPIPEKNGNNGSWSTRSHTWQIHNLLHQLSVSKPAGREKPVFFSKRQATDSKRKPEHHSPRPATSNKPKGGCRMLVLTTMTWMGPEAIRTIRQWPEPWNLGSGLHGSYVYLGVSYPKDSGQLIINPWHILGKTLLKVKLLVGSTCRIPRSTQRS